MRNPLAIALVVALVGAGPAFSMAPAPRKSIDVERFMGRWYEILRTPNNAQKNCYGAFQVWAQIAPGKFSIAQVCHRDSPTGSEHRIQTGARILDAPANTKFQASFFGGIFHRDYWVLDHADDYGWMIASTSDGKFIGILSRRPELAKREVETLRAKVAAMGLDAGGLVAADAGVD